MQWILRDPINPMRTGGQDACMQLNSCIRRRPEMHTCLRGCKHNRCNDPEGMGRATPSTQWELCRTQRLPAAALLPPVAGRDAGMHAGLQHHRECELPRSTSNGVQEPACNEEVCMQTSTPTTYARSCAPAPVAARGAGMHAGLLTRTRILRDATGCINKHAPEDQTNTTRAGPDTNGKRLE